MEMDQRIKPRRELPPIKVWVTEMEREIITQRAVQTRRSLSGFLVAVGLNTPIRSVVELSAVADLVRINGDLGRVAGLLKLWLLEKRGIGARPSEVELMMTEFRELQREIGLIMSRIVK